MKKLLKIVIGWKVQLALAMFFLVGSIVLIIAAYILHIRDRVEYVSALSEIALISAGLSAVIAALVMMEMMTGPTLNTINEKMNQILEKLDQ